MKITIEFYEIMDSDYTGIHLHTPYSVYKNYEQDVDQEIWLNQTIDSEVDENGLAILIKSLDLELNNATDTETHHNQ